MKSKFISLLLIACIMVNIVPLNVVMAQTGNPDLASCMELYEEYMAYYEDSEDIIAGYIMVDINNDGIPEMFTYSTYKRTGNYNSYYFCRMFTIKNGEVIEDSPWIKDGSQWMIMFNELPDKVLGRDSYVRVLQDLETKEYFLGVLYKHETEKTTSYLFERINYDPKNGASIERLNEGYPELSGTETDKYGVTDAEIVTLDYKLQYMTPGDERKAILRKNLFDKYIKIVGEKPSVDADKNTVVVETPDLPEHNFTAKKSDKSQYKAPVFKDITKEDNYTDYILALGYLNLFKGDQNGNFNPESTITRAEFATIVCRMLGYENEANKYKSKTVYTDVPSSHWASGYIYVASALGIINGYGNGLFGPEDPVKYEQAIKMLVCAVEYNKTDICVSAGVSCPDGIIPYPDGYMAIAKKFSLGDSAYKTGNNAPRKLIAKLIYIALKLPLTDTDNDVRFLSYESYIYSRR